MPWDRWRGEAVEYVRGISVVKTFGQSVFSFKQFKESIDNYEKLGDRLYERPAFPNDVLYYAGEWNFCRPDCCGAGNDIGWRDE